MRPLASTGSHIGVEQRYMAGPSLAWLCDEQCHASQSAVTLTRLDCSVSPPHYCRFYQLSSKNYNGIFPYSPVRQLPIQFFFFSDVSPENLAFTEPQNIGLRQSYTSQVL